MEKRKKLMSFPGIKQFLNRPDPVKIITPTEPAVLANKGTFV
jgi:hypothetical protein